MALVKGDKIACFFTGGYTEASGYMQFFLSKINDSLVYEQCIPNSVRKRKGMPKQIRSDYNGITADALLDKVYECLSASPIKEKFLNGIYKGLLIEDDVDGRFDSFNDDEIASYENKIAQKIKTILGKDCPVFFIYASPEAESWFVSDWNNGFGYFFSDSVYFDSYPTAIRKKFSIELKKQIETKLLKKDTLCIERYAHADDGNYRKLSDDINVLICEQNIRTGTAFSYSKRIHGPQMLKKIDPDKVREKCVFHFSRGFFALKNAILG